MERLRSHNARRRYEVAFFALGWLIGLGFAELIGREVFHSTIGIRWAVPPTVLALALAVAALSGLGPIRLALSVEPAQALKGD